MKASRFWRLLPPFNPNFLLTLFPIMLCLKLTCVFFRCSKKSPWFSVVATPTFKLQRVEIPYGEETHGLQNLPKISLTLLVQATAVDLRPRHQQRWSIPSVGTGHQQSSILHYRQEIQYRVSTSVSSLLILRRRWNRLGMVMTRMCKHQSLRPTPSEVHTTQITETHTYIAETKVWL